MARYTEALDTVWSWVTANGQGGFAASWFNPGGLLVATVLRATELGVALLRVAWMDAIKWDLRFEKIANDYFHHVALTRTRVGNVLWEAFGNYLDFKVYHAGQPTPGLYTPRLPF